jgi:polyribonucleotide nucleotidyltransferase
MTTAFKYFFPTILNPSHQPPFKYEVKYGVKYGVIGQERPKQLPQIEKTNEKIQKNTEIQNEKIMFMFISNQNIGRIIGYNGVTINKLRKTTKAKINISNGKDENGNRKITISGFEDEIEQVENEILNLLKI